MLVRIRIHGRRMILAATTIKNMHAIGTPPADIAISRGLVSTLLAEQHPDLAHLPFEEVDTGWDNAMFRLGDHLAVRLPRRAAAATLIVNEQTWLPRLAGKLTLPVPTPVRLGKASQGYPWNWSVVPWMHGVTANASEPAASQAGVLAGFLRSLHNPAPSDAPQNPVRGVSLSQRREMVEGRLERLVGRTSLITPQIEQIWETALHAPLDLPPTWLHGDLHPRNVLVDRDAITGIIDWGDLTSGDAATDLASIWMLFGDPHARQAALEAYGHISEATLQRAKGWAVLFSVFMLDTGLIDNPRHAEIGVRTLHRLAEPM
jgi:aminoglycoside phosphotransferase (APT) family kinase protein